MITSLTVCNLCGGPHSLNDCPGFLEKTLAERRDFIKAKALCYSCLIPSHVSKFCKSRLICKSCNKRHPTSLHDYNWKSDLKKVKDKNKIISQTEVDNYKTVSSPTTVCGVTEAGDIPISIGIAPVWLHHESDPSHRFKVYAHNGSGETFVTEQCLESLKF